MAGFRQYYLLRFRKRSWFWSKFPFVFTQDTNDDDYRQIIKVASDKTTLCKVTRTHIRHTVCVTPDVRRGPGWNTKVFGESPGKTGHRWTERVTGKEVLSTVHLCPASWQPASKALVLRVDYSGRSWSFSEALRSWLHGCSPVACCPPANMTNTHCSVTYCWLSMEGEL